MTDSFEKARERRERDRARVREALERAGRDGEPAVDALLERVPDIVAEAARRRAARARGDVLTASIPVARSAIPRLAAAAALLVAVSTLLLATGAGATATGAAGDATGVESTSVEARLLGGNGVTQDWMLRSILGPADAEE